MWELTKYLNIHKQITDHHLEEMKVLKETHSIIPIFDSQTKNINKIIKGLEQIAE